MAEANATTIDEWKMSKIGSLERMANIRQGLHTKKLKRLSTICALDPPMRSRAAMYPARITMPMTQNPCNAFSSPISSPCLCHDHARAWRFGYGYQCVIGVRPSPFPSHIAPRGV